MKQRRAADSASLLPAAELIPAAVEERRLTEATIAQAAEVMPPMAGDGVVAPEAAAAAEVAAEKKADEPDDRCLASGRPL